MRDARWARLSIALAGWLVCCVVQKAAAAPPTEERPAKPRADGDAVAASIGGKGMRLRGERADVVEFARMIADGVEGSPTMQKLIAEIRSEIDPVQTIDVVLARHARGVFIDSFEQHIVDLEDLERLPSAHDDDLADNEITREEQIVHFLAERRHAAKIAAQFRRLGKPEPPRTLLFAASHEMGQAVENSYRAERGQVAITDASSADVEGSPGEVFMRFVLADGSTSWIKTRDYGRISQVTPPSKE